MEQKHTKLLQIISILIIGLTVSCSKPKFKLVNKTTIKEDHFLITRAEHFQVYNDSIFTIISNTSFLNKYNLKSGELINSFTIEDSLELKKIITNIIEYLPNKDYRIISDIKIAKERYSSNIFTVANYFFDGKNFYIYAWFITPFIGEYNDMEMLMIKKSPTIIKTDIDFNIKKITVFTKSRQKSNILTSFYLSFVKHNNYLYTLNRVAGDSSSLYNTKYPVVSKFEYDKKSDTINNTPVFVDSIYFPKNSSISYYSISLITVYGEFNTYNDSIYISVTNNIYNIKNANKIYTTDEKQIIKDFEINKNNILYVSYLKEKKKYFLNKYYRDDEALISLELTNKKILNSCVHNNKIYLLTKDQENYYVEEYIID